MVRYWSLAILAAGRPRLMGLLVLLCLLKRQPLNAWLEVDVETEISPAHDSLCIDWTPVCDRRSWRPHLSEPSRFWVTTLPTRSRSVRRLQKRERGRAEAHAQRRDATHGPEED